MSSKDKNPALALPYIEPTIRTIVGALCMGLAALFYFQPEHAMLWAGALLFIGINLFQSGFTRWCMMEKLLRALGFRCEIEEIRTLTEKLSESNARLSSYMRTLDLVNEAIVELSLDGTILSASEGWKRLLPYATECPVCTNLTCCILAEDREKVLATLQDVQNSPGETAVLRFRIQCGEQEPVRWVEGKFTAERIENEIRVRAILRDVTEAHLREHEMQHLALHDPLTGLPNRNRLEKQMHELLNRSRVRGGAVGLLFIDLDNFKRVNDRYGHAQGDRLLRKVAGALHEACRRTETPCRWGGDEFVVLIELQEEKDPRAHLRARAHSLMAAVERALRDERMHEIVTLSIGGALYPDDAASADELLLQADSALYEAKGRGKNNVRIQGMERDTGSDTLSGATAQAGTS